MSASSQAGLFLVDFFGGLFVSILLLRLLLPLVKADFYNPISQLVVKVTAPLLLPFRKICPMVGRFDTSVLLLLLVFQVAILLAKIALAGISPAPAEIAMVTFALLANSLLNIYFYGIIAIIIISWVAPQSRHPALLLIQQIIEPALAPFRRLLPAMGGLDLSPMLAMVTIYVLRIFLSNM